MDHSQAGPAKIRGKWLVEPGAQGAAAVVGPAGAAAVVGSAGAAATAADSARTAAGAAPADSGPVPSQPHTLAFSPADGRRLGLAPGATAILALGGLSCEVKAEADASLGRGRLRVDAATAGRLLLPPPGVPWSLRRSGPALVLGPVIGVLAALRRKKLGSLERDRSALVSRYAEVGGLVYLFSVEDCHPGQKTVNGLGYFPGEAGQSPVSGAGPEPSSGTGPGPSSGVWRPGVFPFPEVVFVHHRQRGYGEAVGGLADALGRRLFNAKPFSKWQAWEWLKDDPVVSRHLPETRALEGAADLFAVLAAHGAAYAKAATGSRGRKVFRVDPQGEGGKGVVLRRRVAGENEETTLDTPEKVEVWARGLAAGGRWLVQEAVPLAEVNGRPVDFRVILQLTPGGAWVSQSIVARIGPQSSVVTNVRSGADARPGRGVLREMYGRARAREMVSRMEELARAVGDALGRTGRHYANLGLDLAIGQDGRLWVLEINNVDPEHVVLDWAGEPEVFDRVMSNILAYAAWVAGW